MLEDIKRIEERFWPRVEKTDTCWIWCGARDADGYGQISVTLSAGRRCVAAHRVAYALDRGRYPDGQIVRHRCDVRACVNPAHLVSGSHADNVRDRVRRRRSARGERNGRAKLEPREVVRIRERLARNATVAGLAREYGVTRKAIRLIRDRVTWTHI